MVFKLASKTEKQFRNGVIAIQKEKSIMNFNKTYILEQVYSSKVLMQDFCYNYIKNKSGDKAEMLLTDTDSVTYKIEAGDF